MIRRLPTNHIDQTPGICGGRPRIAGHRIRVQDIAWLHESQGFTPDEILSHYPALTLGEIHAALAFFYDHEDEIRSDWTTDEQSIDENRRLVPSKILRKIIGDDSDASFSS
jgi:uncharacterized protein (DUF433 family)